ncbi:hypothetical protein LCGC14_0812130 [marine sediment metagenome]|uniref:Uncharacterized protein n=1 Tax=marine sediment metagenome TaxID=412755 RepID=A0A0F9PLC1_9ZZZZ
MIDNTPRILLHYSDIEKVRDTLAAALAFHAHRDEMNAQVHLAAKCRFSPLTSELTAALERMNKWLKPEEEAEDE